MYRMSFELRKSVARKAKELAGEHVPCSIGDVQWSAPVNL